jgi:hypothetical protein
MPGCCWALAMLNAEFRMQTMNTAHHIERLDVWRDGF